MPQAAHKSADDRQRVEAVRRDLPDVTEETERPTGERPPVGWFGPWALCAAMISSAVALWVTAAHASTTGMRTPLPWPVISAAVFVAGMLVTHVRVREHSVSLSPISEMVVVALVVLRPLDALAALIVAALVHAAIERQSVFKSIFNASNHLVGAGVSFWVIRWTIGGSSPVSLRGWGAVASGCLLFDLVIYGLILAVIALRGGRIDRMKLAEMLLSVGIAAPTDAFLGVLAISMLWLNSTVGIGIFFVVLGGAWWILRAQRRLRERHESLELLYRFSQSLAGLTEASEVLSAVLEGAEELLSCRQAEVVIVRDTSCLRSSRHPTGALVHDDSRDLDPMELEVVRSGNARLITRNERDPDTIELLRQRGWRDEMITPIEGGVGFAGLMIVGDRLGETSTFSDADLRLFQTLAAHSSVALRGSELLGRLREEVSARSYEALHDTLTGLGNRAYFSHRLDTALHEIRDGVVAVIMIDLNNFKEINDTLGHHTGDTILQEAATRLVDAVGRSGTASRIGGDEFAVVLAGMTTVEEVIAVTRRIISTVSEPIATESLTINLQCSLGVAVAPDDGLEAPNLLRRADVAMYVAKASGTGLELYDPATDPNTTRRLRLTSDLRKAVQDDALELWYQPKASLETGQITGVEALCRWAHPIYGNIPPDEFIPLAEQSGTIGPLTWWVMSKALTQLGEWDRCLPFPIDVAVNVSARNLIEADLVERLSKLITRANVAPERLTVELTESTIMSDPDRAERILAEVANLGARIAIDDFGTGYSSLSRLNRLPVSEIKVDKSFVTEMTTANTQPIVAATIELAASLGQRVTAEGVEDRNTWDRLREMGCDSVQGYFLARPMPAAVCTEWLLARQRPELGLPLPA
jgi:diguanylate cyclase (GGDEF)-like protein